MASIFRPLNLHLHRDESCWFSVNSDFLRSSYWYNLKRSCKLEVIMKHFHDLYRFKTAKCSKPMLRYRLTNDTYSAFSGHHHPASHRKKEQNSVMFEYWHSSKNNRCSCVRCVCVCVCVCVYSPNGIVCSYAGYTHTYRTQLRKVTWE
jgi:hypothetical protein